MIWPSIILLLICFFCMHVEEIKYLILVLRAIIMGQKSEKIPIIRTCGILTLRKSAKYKECKIQIFYPWWRPYHCTKFDEILTRDKGWFLLRAAKTIAFEEYLIVKRWIFVKLILFSLPIFAQISSNFYIIFFTICGNKWVGYVE